MKKCFHNICNAKYSLRKSFVLLLLFSVSFVYSQDKIVREDLKTSAENQMRVGRYGEAIDLLNKFISANPRFAVGYHLRGLSFEARGQYQQSVLDLRRATRLSPNNQTYINDLNRILTTWHDLLRKKIQGHEREIAIDPSKAVNYLEIGKSYRFLEEWEIAEEWYDQYLARDDNASPDEIIRYTEILAKTGSLKKGEIILEKFVKRYPEDWRLWSRYGYFLLWLAKYPQAKNAFEASLTLKPFFQEAQDGLDLVNREGYLRQNTPRSFEQVYPIDRYYNILRRNPDDHETRFKLIDDLIKANRVEEAYQQLQILSIEFMDDPRYEEKWEYVTNYRDENYNKKIEEYLAKLETNPNDKTALKEVTQYYSYLEDYEEAFNWYETYFTNNPNDKDKELRFQFSKTAAWARYFDKSIEVIDGLLLEEPNNLDYQLMKGQLLVWTDGDIVQAKSFTENVLSRRPNNLEALLLMGLIKIREKQFDEAQNYADQAKSIDPINNEVIKLQSNIDFQRMRAEEERLYAIIEKGRQQVMKGNCKSALPFYEDYLSQAEPNILILKEYGDVNFCAKNYNMALEIYNSVLDEGYDYDVKLERAKVYFALGDSLIAVKEFEELVKEDSLNFEANLYLGDSYAKIEEYDLAEAKYDSLLVWDLDSTQISMVELRKGWIPRTGIRGLLETFPNYIGISPSVAFYNDNVGFKYSNLGARVDLGVNNFLTVGFSFFRTNIRSPELSRTFSTFKGYMTFRFAENLTGGVGFGTVNSVGITAQRETELSLRYEKEKEYYLYANMRTSDAGVLLYSPDLVDIRMGAKIYTIDAKVFDFKGFIFQMHYQYVSIAENHPDYGDNKGNDFQLRIGRQISERWKVGYEYYLSNYRYDSEYYYSPQYFQSHSLWFDIDFSEKNLYELYLRGKAGTIPANSLMTIEGQAEFIYDITTGLKLNARLSAGSTARENQQYSYLSGQLSMYISL